jgi:hypothetical protein
MQALCGPHRLADKFLQAAFGEIQPVPAKGGQAVSRQILDTPLP